MKTILGILCLGLPGWVCLIWGFVKARRFRRRIEAESARAEGIITGYETEQQAWGRGVTTVYHPVVCFSVDSREYRAAAEFGCVELRNEAPRRPLEGSRVVLYYSPSNPFRFHLEQERTDAGRGLIRIGLYVVAFAAVVSVFAAVVLKW